MSPKPTTNPTAPAPSCSLKGGAGDSFTSKLLRDFPWGPITHIHQIGEYSIVEYTDKHSNFSQLFHPYIATKDTHRSFNSLDEAIIGVLAYKYDGCNTQADRLISSMLGIYEAKGHQ